MVLAWIILVLLSLGFAGVLHQLRLLERTVREISTRTEPILAADELPVGSRIRSFLVPGRNLFVLFTNPGCTSCYAVAAELNKTVTDSPELEVLEVSDGSCGAELRCLEQARGERLALSIHATPCVVIVDDHGRILSKAVLGTGDLRQWMARWAIHQNPVTSEVKF